MFLKIITFFMPWFLRRRILNHFFGYQIHSSARIGFSWIYPKQLVMKEKSAIGHLNVAIHLDKIVLGKNSEIVRNNWITGYPTNTTSKHFEHQIHRKSELHIGNNSSITKSHHLDCTNTITIGSFATIAGYKSQFLTHSIDVQENRQSSSPITIGDYTFVSTNVVVLGGSCLPNNSILGAKGLLNKCYQDNWYLYGGVPAQPIKKINPNAKYFSRTSGFVY